MYTYIHVYICVYIYVYIRKKTFVLNQDSMKLHDETVRKIADIICFEAARTITRAVQCWRWWLSVMRA